jgi:predicted DNA-binding protein
MTTIAISLSDESMIRLNQLASRSGVSAEELVRSGVEQWLSKSTDDVGQTAEYLLNKNDELYQRLAK